MFRSEFRRQESIRVGFIIRSQIGVVTLKNRQHKDEQKHGCYSFSNVISKCVFYLNSISFS